MAGRSILMDLHSFRLTFSSEARELLQTSAEQALVPYNSLVQMSANIKEVLGGRGTKLESFLDTSRDALLKEFKAHLSK